MSAARIRVPATRSKGFPGGSVGKEMATPLQYSCLRNAMDSEVWRVTVHRVTKNRTRLKWLSAHVTRSRVHDLLDHGWCHLYSPQRAQGPGRTEVGSGRTEVQAGRDHQDQNESGLRAKLGPGVSRLRRVFRDPESVSLHRGSGHTAPWTTDRKSVV